MRMSNYTPGFIVSYDAAKKLARVRIPGVTDGAELFPEAMFSFPIGDKSEHTDIRILVGDRVWLDFVNGDPRYPIITGYRPKETDNAVDWRRLHHTNIDLTADTDLRLVATGAGVLVQGGATVTVRAPSVLVDASSSITLRAPTITMDGNTVCTGTMTVQHMLTYLAGLTGAGACLSNGHEVGSVHTHGGIRRGTSFSDPVA